MFLNEIHKALFTGCFWHFCCSQVSAALLVCVGCAAHNTGYDSFGAGHKADAAGRHHRYSKRSPSAQVNPAQIRTYLAVNALRDSSNAILERQEERRKEAFAAHIDAHNDALNDAQAFHTAAHNAARDAADDAAKKRRKEAAADRARDAAAGGTKTSRVSGSAGLKRSGPSQRGPSLLSKIGKILQKITQKLFHRQ